MIPADVRTCACKGLNLAYAEGVPVHPDVEPIARKLCAGGELTATDKLHLGQFHTNEDFWPEGAERRDQLRHLQMGGWSAREWVFGSVTASPPPAPVNDPNGVLERLNAATAGAFDVSIDAAEVTQDRLDKLTARLKSIDERLRAKVEGILAVTLKVAAGKVGVQLARAGTKRQQLPADAVELHNEHGNTLEFLHALKPEHAGLVRTWALAALSVTEEELARAELAKLGDEVIPAFEDASAEIIAAIAAELGYDPDDVAAELAPVHEQGRAAVEDYLAAIGPALVLGRLNAATEPGVTGVRASVPSNLVDDVLRVGGGADFTVQGGVPISEAGNRFRNGIEIEGDFFAQSDQVLDAIEVVDDDGVRPGYDKTFSHADYRPGGRKGKKSNPLHQRQHGKPQAEAEVAPGAQRGCECRWDPALTVQAAGTIAVCPECGLPRL